MEVKGMLTKTGAKVHVCFGKEVVTNLWGAWVVVDDLALIAELRACNMESTKINSVRQAHMIDWTTLVHQYRRAPKGQVTVQAQGAPAPENTEEQAEQKPDDQTEEAQPESQPDDKMIRMFRADAVGRMQKFFSEFKFSPAARFVNTLARQESPYAAKQYVNGYVHLINNCDANDIVEKMKSPEFDGIVNDITKYPPTKQINTRLDIYFGDAGTGKTTKAVNEYPTANVVPCNASMLPDELMRTFDFNDENGNPVFKPSTLRLAMEAGQPIIFDEINLLSFDCLRLLQTLTDGKSTINYNGDTITIKDGFKIIGTMNLTVNDQVYNLPEPLVDRAATIKEFKLSTEELVDYAF